MELAEQPSASKRSWSNSRTAAWRRASAALDGAKRPGLPAGPSAAHTGQAFRSSSTMAKS
jgi:hypothetical protein